MSQSKEGDLCKTGFPLPRENADLVGHEDVEREIIQSYNANRLAHAWLICGRRGIGKATLAYRVARFLFEHSNRASEFDLIGSTPQGTRIDENPENLFVPAGSQVFRRVAAGSHADLMTVELGHTDDSKKKPRTEIVVSDVRRISPFLSMTPAEGGWRIVIVDGADLMNRNAMNAVLKVLEEPPPRSLLLLVCHNPGRLLPTVRSRCRQLNLTPLSRPEIRELITRFYPEMDPPDVELLSDLSEGSIGRAATLAEEGGLELFRDLSALLASLPEVDSGSLHIFADKLARVGQEQAFLTFGELLKNWLSGLVQMKATGIEDGNIYFGHSGAERAQRIIHDGNLDRWFQVWEKVSLMLARTGHANLDRKQVVLSAILAIRDAARKTS